jgi:hypothetical protein
MATLTEQIVALLTKLGSDISALRTASASGIVKTDGVTGMLSLVSDTPKVTLTTPTAAKTLARVEYTITVDQATAVTLTHKDDSGSYVAETASSGTLRRVLAGHAFAPVASDGVTILMRPIKDSALGASIVYDRVSGNVRSINMSVSPSSGYTFVSGSVQSISLYKGV